MENEWLSKKKLNSKLMQDGQKIQLQPHWFANLKKIIYKSEIQSDWRSYILDKKRKMCCILFVATTPFLLVRIYVETVEPHWARGSLLCLQSLYIQWCGNLIHEGINKTRPWIDTGPLLIGSSTYISVSLARTWTYIVVE